MERWCQDSATATRATAAADATATAAAASAAAAAPSTSGKTGLARGTSSALRPLVPPAVLELRAFVGRTEQALAETRRAREAARREGGLVLAWLGEAPPVVEGGGGEAGGVGRGGVPSKAKEPPLADFFATLAGVVRSLGAATADNAAAKDRLARAARREEEAAAKATATAAKAASPEGQALPGSEKNVLSAEGTGAASRCRGDKSFGGSGGAESFKPRRVSRLSNGGGGAQKKRASLLNHRRSSLLLVAGATGGGGGGAVDGSGVGGLRSSTSAQGKGRVASRRDAGGSGGLLGALSRMRANMQGGADAAGDSSSDEDLWASDGDSDGGVAASGV